MVNTLIVLGLGFGMIGTALMALQSLKNPLRYDKGKASFGYLPKEDPNRTDPVISGRKIWLQRIGFGFIGFGFFLQLMGIF